MVRVGRSIARLLPIREDTGADPLVSKSPSGGVSPSCTPQCLLPSTPSFSVLLGAFPTRVPRTRRIRASYVHILSRGLLVGGLAYRAFS